MTSTFICAGRKRALCRAVVLWGLLLLAPSGAAPEAAGPLMLAGPDSSSIFLVQPGSRTLTLLTRGGVVVAIQLLDANPTAMALDARRGLLYVALGGRRGSRILLLQAKDLRRLGMLATTMTVTSLSAVAGHDAFYAYDAAIQRPVFATYAPNGSVHLSQIKSVPRSPVAHLHLMMDRSQGTGLSGTYWASGFTPGEIVAVSWGASNQGSLRADRFGVISGRLPDGAVIRRGGYSLGLYGLTSHISLVQLVGVQPHPRIVQRPLAPPLPPLYLGLLPGPITVVHLPIVGGKARLPVSAASLPVLALMALWRLRRRKRKRRTSRPATGRSGKTKP